MGEVTLPCLRMITYSVLRLPARRREPSEEIPQLESAPVSVKRVELNRAPRRPGYLDILGVVWRRFSAAARLLNSG